VNEDFYHVASYSNTGQESEFCAPGDQLPSNSDICIFSNALWPDYERYCSHFDMVLSTGSLGAYYYSIGTSMAAPHAAGVAALIISENPSKFKGRPSQVRAEMRKCAEDKGTPGRDDIFGHGAIASIGRRRSRIFLAGTGLRTVDSQI
jgi:subtilisin family serine protease